MTSCSSRLLRVRLVKLYSEETYGRNQVSSETGWCKNEAVKLYSLNMTRARPRYLLLKSSLHGNYSQNIHTVCMEFDREY